MAPSNAAWGYSSAQGGYYHTGIGITDREFWALSRNEKIALFAASTLAAGPVGIMTGGTRLAFGAWRARLIIAGILGYGITSSPRGGGPGQSPISTNTPPSIEEVGRMITSPSASEQTARAKILKKTRCPPGHHWSYRHKRCVRTKKYHKY